MEREREGKFRTLEQREKLRIALCSLYICVYSLFSLSLLVLYIYEKRSKPLSLSDAIERRRRAWPRFLCVFWLLFLLSI